jgi:hypothetical protein
MACDSMTLKRLSSIKPVNLKTTLPFFGFITEKSTEVSIYLSRRLITPPYSL